MLQFNQRNVCVISTAKLPTMLQQFIIKKQITEVNMARVIGWGWILGLFSARLGLSPVFPSCKNHRDLETSAECLVEEESGLELGNEWEPREDRYGHEEDNCHYVLISPPKLHYRCPESKPSQQRPARLPDLRKHKIEMRLFSLVFPLWMADNLSWKELYQSYEIFSFPLWQPNRSWSTTCCTAAVNDLDPRIQISGVL